MRVVGVISEFNPFHNGHERLFTRLRERLGDDARIVCAMSGAFTQRGEAAIVDKWTRAEMALTCGADIVVELPTLFVVRDAEHFALGGVALLAGLGVVTHLGFGSETGGTSPLVQPENAQKIREGLARGETLARARGAHTGHPNDALGAEYGKALACLDSTLQPVIIQREGASHHESQLASITSASAIRAAMWAGKDVAEAVPVAASNILSDAEVLEADRLDTALLYALRMMPPARLAQILDVSEGLEQRILRIAQTATTRETLLAAVKCKRYTWARLSRILTQAMLGITKELAAQCPLPTYARVLGCRESARPLLRQMRERASLPIWQKISPNHTDPCLALDIRAGDLWALGIKNPGARQGHSDFTHACVQVPTLNTQYPPSS